MVELPTICKVVINGKKGWFVPHQSHPIYDELSGFVRDGKAMAVDLGSIGKANLPSGRIKYPDLYEKFWSAYHPGKREDKKDTFNEWKALTPAEKMALPAAAEAYAAKCQLENTPDRYIIHPKRFITTGRFESYVDRGKDTAGLKAVEFWDQQFLGSTGVPYPWKNEDRDNLVMDVKRMGLDSWVDKVWFFFAGNDQKVKEGKDRLGIHYATFRSLLTGPLAYSGLKRKAACPHCGNVNGHSFDCPVKHRRRAEEQKIRDEIEAGKEEGMDILRGLKEKMR
jgi:hypothetical protein